MFLEIAIEKLDPDGSRGRDLWADAIKAFSEGIFDAGFDGWASNLRLFQTSGTIRGDGTISGTPFAGVAAPLVGFVRSLKFEG